MDDRIGKYLLSMDILKVGIFLLLLAQLFNSCGKVNHPAENVNYQDMMIRMAEIEIDSVYFDEYISILKEEAKASVKLEEGVLCIYPMYQKEHPTQIRLLEIYADKAAYEAHLKTSHFLHYKTTTFPMVKSLNLVDMKAIDEEMMSLVFTKIQ